MARGKRWKEDRMPNGRLPDEVLPDTPMYKLNESWIKKVNEKGATILDIGNPANSDSIFYKMEQSAVKWD